MKKNFENIGIGVIFFVMLGYAFVIGIKDPMEHSKIDNLNVETENQIDDSEIQVSITEKKIEANGMTLSVNKKLNFISLVKLIADYDESKQYDSFKKQIYEDFKQYKDHKIFKYIEQKSSKKGEGVESNLESLYSFVNMYTNEKFEFNNECPQYQEMKKMVPKFNEDMVQMAKYLKSFYSYCGYEKYYNEHSEEYGEFAKKVSNIKINSDYKKELEEFYGVKISEVNIGINMIGDVESSQWEKCEGKDMKLNISVKVPCEFTDNDEKGIEEKIKQYMVCNSCVVYSENVIYKISIPQEIQSKCKEKHADDAKDYSNVETYIRYGLNYTIQTYLECKANESKMKEQIEFLKQMGYPFADKLVEKIKSYDGNKEKYKDFEEFIPELLKVFTE